MFQPSQADVRRFFCGVYAKGVAAQVMEPMEQLVWQWVQLHPQYFDALADVEAALAAMGPTASPDPVDNPFLHLSMHLTISEQCSIDQPRGIRQAVDLLAARRGDLHQAHHEVMECLGTMVWESQCSGRPPDGHAYIDAVQRRATQ
jgi:hypothetical protein